MAAAATTRSPYCANTEASCLNCAFFARLALISARGGTERFQRQTDQLLQPPTPACGWTSIGWKGWWRRLRPAEDPKRARWKPLLVSSCLKHPDRFSWRWERRFCPKRMRSYPPASCPAAGVWPFSKSCGNELAAIRSGSIIVKTWYLISG